MTINTLYELARNSVEKFASKVAFSMFEGDDVTYAEVDRRIAKVQEILTGAGLQAGDKVALLSSNMPNWGVCYFAVTSAGMIAVPILPDFSGEELDMIIEHSEARALLVSDKLFTKLSKRPSDGSTSWSAPRTSESSPSRSMPKVRRRCPNPMIWRSSSILRELPPSPRV